MVRPGLVGEREGAPVDTEQVLRTDIDRNLDGFGGIGVLGAHEPARCVGSDGQYGDERISAAAADFGEDLAVLVSSVACAIDAAGGRVDNEAGP